MSKARDRSARAGSDPLIIGSSKLATDSNNNLSVLDNSDAPKKLIASELEIGDSSNKVIIKKGSDNKVAFQTQASGGDATDSNAGGGVTVVANITALQALTGSAVGDLAFVSANNKLYLRQTNGWYTVATVANATPVISSAGNASYSFATDGTPIVITVTATDSEGETITYAHTVSSGSLTNGGGATATVTQGTGGNVNQFTITPSTNTAYAGSFSLTFTAQDPNGNTATSSASSFTLAFLPEGSTTFDGSGDYLLTAANSNLVVGTQDMCLEYWVKFASLSAYSQMFDFRKYGAGYSTYNLFHYFEPSDNTIKFGEYNVGITSSALSVDTWYHVATVRNSNVFTLYLNGTSQGTYSTTDSFSSDTITIGIHGNNRSQSSHNGKISNFRLVIGSPVYTGNFTPPTSPLPAITNTQLLTCQNNTGTITDGSSNNITITAGGNASASTDHPF
tara:strand:+ start:8 stop:1357 length:1350 start_codon:yes stop_codon:yes gene_type:complete